jgi:hypothetical protein
VANRGDGGLGRGVAGLRRPADPLPAVADNTLPLDDSSPLRKNGAWVDAQKRLSPIGFWKAGQDFGRMLAPGLIRWA